MSTPKRDLVEILLEGTKVKKVNISHHVKKRKKPVKKQIILDVNKVAFRYEPTRKGSTFKIPIKSLTSVTYGLSSHCKNVDKHHPSTHQFTVEFLLEDGKTIRLLFITNTEEEAKDWTEGLEYLKGYNESLGNSIRPIWLKDLFEKFDHDNNGGLALSEIDQLLKHINVRLAEDKIKQQFKRLDMERLSTKDFPQFFHDLLDFTVVQGIFERYQDENSSTWSMENLRKFLLQVQKIQDDTLIYRQELISKFTSAPDPTRLNFFGFLDYLLSPDNDIIEPAHLDLHHDMTQPLSHYFINSSHNTYLTADQWKGPSSVESYIDTLQKGCKCVELDCWDGDEGEPVIYHGYTLTSKILFKDVIEAVNEHFPHDSYPLILSFENHCSVKQQNIMANHLRNILADRLCEEDNLNDDLLPSPEYFKGKILIKGKKIPMNYDNVDGFGDVYEADISEEDEAQECINIIANKKELIDVDENYFFENVTKDDDVRKKKSDEMKERKKLKLGRNLSDLVNYVQAVHFRSFSEALKDQPCFEMSSLNETKFMAFVKANSRQFVEYNKKFLTRTYPSGSRIDSSNYNPIKAWNVGCQIVALNFQTSGEMMDLNDGIFQFNGKSGYLLKPKYLRDERITFDPEQIGPYSFIKSKSVKITIISGHFLPRAEEDIVDAYVLFEVYGISQDQQSDKFRTKTIRNNGFNPLWNETFTFELMAPELAVFRFVVMDKDFGNDDFVAQCVLPFTVLRPGLRRLGLNRHNGECVGEPCLLMNMEID